MQKKPAGNGWLLCGLLLYAVANVIGVILAATGLVHPPWGILHFFTFVGPLSGILVTCGAQVLCERRPFTWLSVIGFALAMILAAFLNFQALRSAIAAV